MRLAIITIAGIMFMASPGDTRAVQHGLDLTEGERYELASPVNADNAIDLNSDIESRAQRKPDSGSQSNPMILAAGGPLCGSSRPVIYQNSAGSLNYRWCDAGNKIAYADVYQNIGGTLYYVSSTQLACPHPPAPVRRVVCR